MTQIIKNTLASLAIIGLIMAFPLQLELKIIIILIAFTSAAWVYIDAKKIEIQKYKSTALGLNTPSEAAAAVALFWIIAFPAYIIRRKRILNGKIQIASDSNELKKISKVIPTLWAILFIPSIPVAFLSLFISDAPSRGVLSDFFRMTAFFSGLALPISLIIGAIAGFTNMREKVLLYLPLIDIAVFLVSIILSGFF